MSVTGDRLRALRKEKGISQEAVAEVLGITRTAYNKYESGVIKTVRKLEELFIKLACFIDSLFRLTGFSANLYTNSIQ